MQNVTIKSHTFEDISDAAELARRFVRLVPKYGRGELPALDGTGNVTIYLNIPVGEYTYRPMRGCPKWLRAEIKGRSYCPENVANSIAGEIRQQMDAYAQIVSIILYHRRSYNVRQLELPF